MTIDCLLSYESNNAIWRNNFIIKFLFLDKILFLCFIIRVLFKYHKTPTIGGQNNGNTESYTNF